MSATYEDSIGFGWLLRPGAQPGVFVGECQGQRVYGRTEEECTALIEDRAAQLVRRRKQKTSKEQ